MGGVAPSAGSKVLSGGRRRCDWSSLCASWARPLLKQWQMILDCRIGANIEGIKKASARDVLRGCGLNAGPRPNVSIRGRLRCGLTAWVIFVLAFAMASRG